LSGVVRHVFTHFPLELVVYRTKVSETTPAPPGTRWIPLSEIGNEALPNLMRKVLAHALRGQPPAALLPRPQSD
jgi:A/G-specific adenine glycosylase